MADLDFISANVGDASPVGYGIRLSFKAAATVEAGQALYIDSNGAVDLADASSAGTAVCIGVALDSVTAGETLSVLHRGYLSGFTLTAAAYGALVMVSDTAGDLDVGGSVTVDAPVGRIGVLPDAARTKVLWIDCAFNLNVLPA